MRRAPAVLLSLPYRRNPKTPHVTSGERLARGEGRAEGQFQAFRGTELDTPAARFGEIPYPTREAVNHVGSDAALRKLLRLAVTARSLDAFSV